MAVKPQDDRDEGKWHGLLISLLIDFDWSESQPNGQINTACESCHRDSDPLCESRSCSVLTVCSALVGREEVSARVLLL
jgi:hypothetical protein